MKVLLQSRVNLFNVYGGDTIQVLKTKEYLGKLGVDADISTELEPDVSGYDIVHLFNLVRPQEIYLQARNAKKMGKKVALSPVYVDYDQYERHARIGFEKYFLNILKKSQAEYLKVLARALKNKEIHKGTLNLLVKGYVNLQKKILNLTDVLLPNSKSELRRISNDFVIKDLPYFIVPNAVDVGLFKADMKAHDTDNAFTDNKLKKFKGCILCVARIEGIKNQLNVIRALKDLPYKLVLIGSVAPNHRKYFDMIRKEAGENVHILGAIKHHLLPAYYKLAKVHILASWFETTGLSSLEAAAMGCSIIITDKGDTREYFNDLAFYCEPGSVDSIRQAIIRAYESPADLKLREHILKNFTWEIAAKRTLEAYKTLMKHNTGQFNGD
jgi:glycosyltransferase involved in cell wall biosynthesis